MRVDECFAAEIGAEAVIADIGAAIVVIVAGRVGDLADATADASKLTIGVLEAAIGATIAIGAAGLSTGEAGTSNAGAVVAIVGATVAVGVAAIAARGAGAGLAGATDAVVGAAVEGSVAGVEVGGAGTATGGADALVTTAGAAGGIAETILAHGFAELRLTADVVGIAEEVVTAIAVVVAAISSGFTNGRGGFVGAKAIDANIVVAAGGVAGTGLVDVGTGGGAFSVVTAEAVTAVRGVAAGVGVLGALGIVGTFPAVAGQAIATLNARFTGLVGVKTGVLGFLTKALEAG